MTSKISFDPLALIIKTLWSKHESAHDSVIEQISAFNAAQRQQLLQHLQWHRLTLPFHLAVKNNSETLPAPFIQYLNQRHQAVIQRGLGSIHQIATLDTLFQAADIRYLLFKGMVLSQKLYDSPIIRAPKDIDILIEPEDVQSVHELLIKTGYRLISTQMTPGTPTFSRYMTRQKDLVYSTEKPALAVEIHWRLDMNPTTFPVDFETLWQQRQYIDLESTIVPTFGQLHSYCHFVMHGNISLWGRLCWLSDFYAMCTRTSSLWSSMDRDELKIMLKQLGLLRMDNIARLLTHALFPEHTGTVLLSEPSSIERYICRKIIPALDHSRYLPAPQRYIMRLLLKSSLAYKSKYVANSFQRLLAHERRLTAPDRYDKL